MLSPLYPWVLWYLRKARNRLVFENFTVKEHKVVPSALLEARRLQAAQSLKMQKPSPPARAQIYYDSTISGMECFLDASWQVSTRYGGMGWVFKNPSNGWSLTNSSNRSHVASALLLDALAVKAALCEAVARNFKTLKICSDSKILTECINSRSRCVEIQSVLSDISAICTSFDFTSFKFISRSFNLEADSLEKRSLQDLGNYGLHG